VSIETTVAPAVDGPQARLSRRGVRRADAAAWTSAWLALAALAAWVAQLSSPWLPAVAALAAAWALLARGVPRGLRGAVVLAFAVGLALAGRTQLRLWHVENDWDRVRHDVEERAGARVSAGLDDLFDDGGRAVLGASRVAGAARAPSAELFRGMERVRRETGVAALAVYRPDGVPLVWAGEHRGTVPLEVRRGRVESSYSAGPLFGYVYFSELLTGGNIAVAAVLLEAHVDPGGPVRPYAERFARRNGIVPRFTPPELARGENVWDWATRGGAIVSAVFASLTQDRWRERVRAEGRTQGALVWVLAAALLLASWYASGHRSPRIPLVALTAGALLLPLGALGGDRPPVSHAFSPARFVLPLPGDLTLGHLLLLLAGASTLLLTTTRRAGGPLRVPLGVRALLAGLLLVAALVVVRDSVAGVVLAERASGGAGLVAALTFLVAVALLPLLGSEGARDRSRPALVAAGVALAGGLALGAVAWWTPGRQLPSAWAAAWALPFVLVSLGIPRAAVLRGALLPWAAAVWIGGTVALGTLWTMHLDERLHAAERELERLGTAADPFLDFLLRQFAERVLSLDAEGRRGVSLLYQAWGDAGLAREGYEGRVTLWEEGSPATELRLAEAPLPVERIAPLLAEAHGRSVPRLERVTDVPGLHYLLAVPLPDGRSVSVVVPPRAYLARATSLARVLDPTEHSFGYGGGVALTLVPAGPDETAEPGGTRWLRSPQGWRSEAIAPFPEGAMHAHLLIPVAPPFLLLTRGLLALVAVISAASVLWAIARTLCGDPLGIDPARRGWISTFRGRLTLALFLFFLLPMAAFGATAYRALSREVVRTGAALAGRALGQAAPEAEWQPLAQVAPRVGAELLLYRDGVLTEAAAPEVIDLGLYHSWLPPETFLDFAVGEAVERVEERRVADHRYLVAYRRMGERQVLASPTPLATGEIARRRAELTDVVALAGLLGAALSVILSLAVARALSRPIDLLAGAATSVGEGDLSVRLPPGRRDEFGPVYRAFDRMVQGLAEARTALLRETRRTEAIVEQAGTGVVALDARGRVQLANPRAEQILEERLEAGQDLPADGPLPRAVGGAVREFLASGAGERSEDREVEGKVVRLRMRRLEVAGGERGTVLVLEDVTAELRTARVLAWGEMARQVAHEIKNPLTPIKLAVQHIRRAHGDRRADFDTILERNVEAVLREIDHLGEISRAFARFGTPAEPGAPVEPVEVDRVAGETLALYRGGSDGIEYVLEVAPRTPPALAREGELKEVLVNLLENARAALEDGRVRVSVAPAAGGERVSIDVSDTGEGIPEESLPRIFEPHFSTRSSGTGLGLAIVRRLVESWGGEISVDSVRGEGTTVRLLLRADAWP
jgi:two-component system, NtrC family, nitrogen regulation sensor histidine kinase NtrY